MKISSKIIFKERSFPPKKEKVWIFILKEYINAWALQHMEYPGKITGLWSKTESFGHLNNNKKNWIRKKEN